MLYGIVPINKTMAGVLGAVVALLALAVVGVTVAWRLSVTRSRKSYKKWNEEVRAGLCLFSALKPAVNLELVQRRGELVGVQGGAGCLWSAVSWCCLIQGISL